MRATIAIENIDHMRRELDIDDAGLREAIRHLRIGDFVRLTLMNTSTPAPGETLLVRITRIQCLDFHGVLACKPASAALSSLRAGTVLAFTATHIHSLATEYSQRED